jgi:hypothetical protein
MGSGSASAFGSSTSLTWETKYSVSPKQLGNAGIVAFAEWRLDALLEAVFGVTT